MSHNSTGKTATLARSASEGKERGLQSPPLAIDAGRRQETGGRGSRRAAASREDLGSAGASPSRNHRCWSSPRELRLGRRISGRRGFTLLELLLALALTSLVMVIIGMAIDFNLRTLDSSRTNVEEAMVARAVLRHIAADLRNAVLYEPIDVSGVQEMVAGADLDALGAGLDAGGDTTGDTTGGTDDRGTGDSPDTPDAPDASEMEAAAADLGEALSLNTTDIAGTVEPTSVPGLFGNQYELQVDVSHLPRVDQYEAALSAVAQGTTPDRVSDVKTVAYFLQTDEDQAVSTGLADQPTDMGSGLMRREMDRATTSYASQSGTLDPSAGGGSMLAPEVNYLEFRYFDGLEWQVEWDSAQMGGLPVAVEITIGIDPTGGRDPETLDLEEVNDLATTDMSQYMYRLVVHLPAARPTALQDESLDSEGMEAFEGMEALPQ